MTALALTLIAFVAAGRIAELVQSNRNTAALLAQGAVEQGRGHYFVIVALHVCWFAAILYFLPSPPVIRWWALAIFLVLQALRLWIMISLGPWFTTRIITLAGAPLVTSGPYRFMRHPNYAVVVGEIAVLPLVFGEAGVAIVFSVLNALMLAWRIRAEDRALAPRRRAG